MTISKTILLFSLWVMIIPIFSIVALSFQNNGGIAIKWYQAILLNENFTQAFGLSAFISMCTSILTTFISFTISLSWYNKKQMFVVLLSIVVIGLLPPDIMALSISKFSQILGLYNENLFFLVIALTFYTLPFGVLLFWSRFYFIENSIITAAKDIGVKQPYICLLYTSDAADERSSVDLGGRRIIKKKKKIKYVVVHD